MKKTAEKSGFNEPIFTSIELLDGRKCDILEIRPFIIWKAHYIMHVEQDKELGFLPYLLQQILVIDGKKRSIEYIGDLMIDDYIKISEIIEVFMTKLSDLK